MFSVLLLTVSYRLPDQYCACTTYNGDKTMAMSVISSSKNDVYSSECY